MFGGTIGGKVGGRGTKVTAAINSKNILFRFPVACILSTQVNSLIVQICPDRIAVGLFEGDIVNGKLWVQTVCLHINKEASLSAIFY